jgi:ligand-binding sensor domain-containing protein/signal transduction histidine kinase
MVCKRGLTPAVKSVILLCLFFVVAAELFGTPSNVPATAHEVSDYVVTSWHIQDGLPSDRVQAILQTHDGYIWAATFNGVARFDGVRFQRFNDANTPGLRNSLANCLFEDSDGRLWVGSDTGEISWRDSRGFHLLAMPTNWPSAPVDRFAQASDGTMYAVERGGSVVLFRNCKVQDVIGESTGRHYSDLAVDWHGTVWAVRFGGALVQLQKDKEVPMGPAPITDSYRDVARALRGGIWVRDGKRLRRWEDNKWVEDRGVHSWSGRRGVTLFEGPTGDVWVGTVDDGVFIVAPDSSEQHINRSNGLGNDFVSSITSDQEENIWIGTDGGGLELLRHRVLFMVNPPDHWQNRAVLSVSPAKGGGVWIGTEGAGVYKWNKGEFTKMIGPEPLAARDVRCVLEDRTGQLWAGTQGAGLLQGAKDGRLLSVRSRGLPTALQLFYALYEDKEGSLWMGTQDGLARCSQGQWQWIGTDLYRGEIRCLSQTPDGAIWIGMRGGGIARYQNGAFKQYLRPEGLTYEYIWCLFADRDGTIWIGTPGAGLIRWRNGVFDSFTTRDGLPSDFICNIQQDNFGHFWIGSYAGIFRVEKTSFERSPGDGGHPLDYVLLDTSDGLGSLEMAGGNQPSACATDDGRLWYATSAGLAVVDPSLIKRNLRSPSVRIEDVLVDGSPAAFQGSRLGDDLPKGEIVEPPGSGSIEVRYTALSYSPPQRCRFRYRLENLDAQWIDAGTRRSAYYSRLPPGKYGFHVIACNSDGVWNNNGAAISFTILPHFWETWWFAPLCWLSGLSLTAAIVLTIVRQRHLRRLAVIDRARLVERERLRIARDLHDDLGGGLTEINMTSALAQDPNLTMQDARQYFHEISGCSIEMVRALDEIVWAVNPKNDDLNSLISYFCQYAERFLQAVPMSCRFQIPAHLPATPLNAEQRHNLFLAFKESLHNAAKHSNASSLQLHIQVDGEVLRMVVEDDGSGFVEQAIHGRGDGLRNMRERLGQVGGRFEIDSRLGRGTRIVFVLPL